MAIIKKANIDTDPVSVNSFAKVWFDNFLTDMITQGWRVLGSGDGVSFENQGQTAGSGTGIGGAFHVHTGATDAIDTTTPWVAGNWTNVNVAAGSSWVRLATPSDAEHYMEFLFRLQYAVNPGTGNSLEVLMVKDPGRFDTGASAWVWPSIASNATPIRLGARDTHLAEDGGAAVPRFFAPTGAGHMHYVIGDSTVDYDFYLLTQRDSTIGEDFALFGRLRLLTPANRSDGSEDPDPYVVLAKLPQDGAVSATALDTLTSVIYQTEAVLPIDPQKLEDRYGVTFGSSSFSSLVASFGLEDPEVVAAGYAGHYVVEITVAGYENLFVNPVTGKYGVFGPIPITRQGTTTLNGTIIPKFVKGWTKNNLILFSSYNTGSNASYPFLEDEQIGIGGAGVNRRVMWGVLSFMWPDNGAPPY